MSSKHRAGVALTQTELERLNFLTETCKTNRTAVLAAVAAVMSPEELTLLLERHLELKKLEAELRAVANENILKYMRGKTVEQMRTIVKAAQAA